MKKFATYQVDYMGHLVKYLGTYHANSDTDAAAKVMRDNDGITMRDIRVTRIY